MPTYRFRWQTAGKTHSYFHFCFITCSFKISAFRQRICQRERASGEEAGVPEAPEAAADWEGAYWIPGVDLQSRLGTSPTMWDFLCVRICICCVGTWEKWAALSPACRGGVTGGGGWDCRGEVPAGWCMVQEETEPSRWERSRVFVLCFSWSIS